MDALRMVGLAALVGALAAAAVETVDLAEVVMVAVQMAAATVAAVTAVERGDTLVVAMAVAVTGKATAADKVGRMGDATAVTRVVG